MLGPFLLVRDELFLVQPVLSGVSPLGLVPAMGPDSDPVFWSCTWISGEEPILSASSHLI
jgi:hypothetical protein